MVLERAQWVVEDEVVKGIEVPILRRNGDGPGEAGRDDSERSEEWTIIGVPLTKLTGDTVG